MGMYFSIKAIPAGDVQRLLAEPESIASMPSHVTNAGSVSLEKAWHGIHYLLTGSATDGDMPLGFLLQGGEEVGDDLGYGPARLLRPPEVAELDQALAAITDDQFWIRFDADQMTAEGVYPQIWDEAESDLRDEYVMYFHQMKRLISNASAKGCALLLMLR
jgi:hypothetical protein